MSLVNNWTFSLNQLAVDRSTVDNENKSYLLALINFLTAHGWTADGSSNSVATHATNNIATVADLVCAASGAAHSWIILKSPEGLVAGFDGTHTGDQSRVWMLLNFETATVPNNSAYILTTYHQEKPTGGSTTAAPTSTKELGYTQANAKRFGAAALGGIPYFHFAITDKGHFWSGISYRNTGIMSFLTTVLPIGSVESYCGLEYPYAFAGYQYYTNTTSHPLAPSSTTNTVVLWDWNNATSVGYVVLPMYNVSSVLGAGAVMGRVFSGDVFSLRMGILENQNGQSKMIGYVEDFEVTGATALPSMTMNNDGDRCSFFQWMLPANTRIKA